MRCIRLGNVEVVRAVYSVVRGDDWKTMSQRVTTSHVSQEDGHFEASWKSELDEMAFSWEGRVWSDGKKLEIETTGISGQEYQSRRTGMCVLHPREISGLACTVRHNDGSVEEGTFPRSIEPDQPFFDIKSIQHAVSNGRISIDFNGEVFEMEDQRNYSDVSYKTYVRPQAWPQPFQVQEGDQFHNGLSFTFEGDVPAVELPCRVQFTPSEQLHNVPKLGTYGHRHKEEFDFVLDSHTPGDWGPAGIGNLHQADSFIGFNRSRILPEGADGIAFGATPQVHAFDERTIMENAHGISDLVKNAKGFTGGKPVGVGPLALRNRRQEFEDRLETNLGPTWMLASLLSAVEGGADAVCALNDSEYSEELLNVIRLLRTAGQVQLMHSSDPYKALGFQTDGDQKTVLINLRPYITSVHFRGDLELEAYEIRIL